MSLPPANTTTTEVTKVWNRLDTGQLTTLLAYYEVSDYNCTISAEIVVEPPYTQDTGNRIPATVSWNVTVKYTKESKFNE